MSFLSIPDRWNTTQFEITEFGIMVMHYGEPLRSYTDWDRDFLSELQKSVANALRWGIEAEITEDYTRYVFQLMNSVFTTFKIIVEGEVMFETEFVTGELLVLLDVDPTLKNLEQFNHEFYSAS